MFMSILNPRSIESVVMAIAIHFCTQQDKLHEHHLVGNCPTRPGYFYLFGENRDWNSRDNLKIFGKVRKFWAE